MGNSRSSQQRRRHRLDLADKYRNPNRLINCLVIGDDASGRSALIMRYLANEDPVKSSSPIPPGDNMSGMIMPVFDDKVCFSVIAKQRLYNVMLYNIPESLEEQRLRYPEPDVVILCFSLVNQLSFENTTERWHPEVRRHSEKVPIILAGIYSDVRDDIENSPEQLYDSTGALLSPISFSDGVSLGQRIGARAYIECSVDNGLGVEQIFYEAAHATHKSIPLEIAVKDRTVAHRDTIAMKRYNFQHEYLVSHKLFLED